jgi:HEAT repeat protein
MRTLALALLLATPTADAAKYKASKATGNELLTCLAEQKPPVQEDCLDEIVDRRLVQASPQVADMAVNSSSEDVRHQALTTLERLGGTELVPTAHQAVLTDSSTRNRQKALRLIELYGGAESSEVIGQVIAEDSEATARRKAVVIASKKGMSDLEPLLVTTGMADSDGEVALESAKAVILFGNPDSRPAVHERMLTHPDERTREWIIRTIETAPIPLDQAPLLEALDDPHPHSARHAARALKKLGDASVAPILREKAMSARDPAVAEEFSAAAEHLELMAHGEDDGGI